ncbi:MAG: NADH-quinone oxidoreductase subunit NuoF [Desulfobacteraceae bacterium]|nr:NADH-quinone oxidoreductase subunit NuoF [Desulfobacteraceae bacterium]
MSKLTVENLKQIKEKFAHRLTFKDKTYLLICGGTGCHATGSIKVMNALQEEIDAKGLNGKAEIVETGCNGFCAVGPLMVIHPGDIFYQKIKIEDIPEIVQKHLIDGKPVEKLLYKDPVTKKRIPKQNDIPFFAHQMPRALRNKGLINPESIDDYISRDGYQGVAKALLEMQPADIIDQMKRSGMRGRGGAGFPSGLKWEFASKSQSDIKYVLCNADEGDPGAFMDRSLLEADPHAVLEGMVIAAKAIDARKGYVYARTEYPLAIKRLQIAIDTAKQRGLLGEDILGSGFSFDVEIYQGAGAFVCGEETALMRSIEGRRGMPRPRPPFPAHKGLWEKPTILNNVETFANVAQIMVHGGDWYAAAGTKNSKGTKVFAMSGDVNNIGLVEVPMGTSLRKLIYDIGGGIPKKRKFKAVQLGGPSGGCVPEQYLDTPVDYEEIAKVGAIMGSGGVIVMDENTCMVDMARFFMEFIQEESCGKCTPCREGTRRLLQILIKICDGHGEPDDIRHMEMLSDVIRETALCGLGQTGPNPVLSTLRYFRNEFEEHILEKRCPAKRCVNLLKFEIEAELCAKCGLCFKVCPVDAIEWKKKEVARIDQEKCIKCLTCYDKCKFGAIM